MAVDSFDAGRAAPAVFSPLARALHWLMAPLLLAMLFIGFGQVRSVSVWHLRLLALHKPLGLALLLLALLRLGLRLWQQFRHRVPVLPTDLPGWQRAAAKASQVLLYALMLAMPLIGWAMLSAGGSPISLGAGLLVPPLLAPDPVLFAWLRLAHRACAYVLYAIILVHIGAALVHGLIRRDAVWRAMAGRWPARPRRPS